MLPNWTALDPQIERLVACFGAAICTPELVGDGDFCGHIAASARVWNPNRSRVLRVWSAKEARWKLPGAHGEGDFDLHFVALREAGRALGWPPDIQLEGEAVEVIVQQVAEYWNTPAHLHLEVVFEFESQQTEVFPDGARWFDA